MNRLTRFNPFSTHRSFRFRTAFVVTLLLHSLCFAEPANYDLQSDVSYRPNETTDPYIQENCLLDIYRPKVNAEKSPILVWFHGGGLEGGSKTSGLTKKLAQSYASEGITVVVPEYRMSPQVKYPTYLEDAAMAVHYVQTQLGPNTETANIFIGGHSAGGYIASMLAMDPHYLSDAGVDEAKIAGYIPVSGQVMTHFTIAKEKGIERPAIIADEAAPLYHIKQDTLPILIIIGGDDWPARLEENRYFVAAMRKVAKNEHVAIVEVPERNHSGILKGMASPDDPAAVAALSFIRTHKLPADQFIND